MSMTRTRRLGGMLAAVAAGIVIGAGSGEAQQALTFSPPVLPSVEGTWASLPGECGPRGCPFSGMGVGGHPGRRV